MPQRTRACRPRGARRRTHDYGHTNGLAARRLDPTHGRTECRDASFNGLRRRHSHLPFATVCGYTPLMVATLRDVAEAAGVHPATVSKALNNSSDVSAATVARIRKIA